MQPEIRRADPAKEFATQENCFILELANDTGDPDVSIAQARVRPGVSTTWHRLEGIVERGGPEALTKLWSSARHLPTPNEVDAPGLWLARIELPEDD